MHYDLILLWSCAVGMSANTNGVSDLVITSMRGSWGSGRPCACTLSRTFPKQSTGNRNLPDPAYNSPFHSVAVKEVAVCHAVSYKTDRN